MKRVSVVRGLFLFLFLVFAVLATDANVYAATPTWEDLQSFSGIKKMTKVYKEMDVTGDKKVDTVKVVYTPKGTVTDPDYVDGEIKVLVNGKRVYKQTRKGGPCWSVRVIR